MRTKAELEALNGSSSDFSHSFLTESQRAALDAALAAKQTAPASPGASKLSPSPSRELSRANSSRAKSPIKSLRSAGSGTAELQGHTHHKSSQSRKGTGKTKKGGAGGKYTWGSSFDNESPEAEKVDRNDPNYDSGDEKRALAFHSRKVEQVKAYKQAVLAILEEFYVNGDIDDAAATLQELGEPLFQHFFVKKVITLAMDKNDREHEMAANLLSRLYHEVIQADQVQKGFRNLLSSVDDLKLDVPAAEDDLALFLARAVVDDILPPAFLQKLPNGQGSGGGAVRAKAQLHLTARRPAERLLRVWGGTPQATLHHTKEAITSCLQEYLSSKDVSEARHCLRKLAVPFFHHEVVKQALLRCMEEEEESSIGESLVRLLKELASTGDISHSQMARGFQRVSTNLEDTCLDAPKARDVFQKCVTDATTAGWLDPDWNQTPTGAMTSSPNTPLTGGGILGNGLEAATYKATAVATVQEYLNSNDMQEVCSTLEELQQPELAHIFVKQVCQADWSIMDQIAMDRKDREREQLSTLLANLYPNTISQDQMAKGFTRLLHFTEDLQLDNPEAGHLLALFLGRAIVDEALPPSFLAAVLPSLEDHSEGVSVVQSTGVMLSARHAAERLQNCWHGACQTIQQLRDSMQALLAEYLTNGDSLEASRCLMELGVPYYHHELVKRALVMAADDSRDHDAPLLLTLLSQLASSGAINQTQMQKGFERVQQSLEDIALDSPLLKTRFQHYKQQAQQQGWLADSASSDPTH
ncbi:hypothetical protein ABBQ38_012224 [Trebouxia sp. C0009 RCD-2024]